MKILIIGGQGFLGRHCQDLLADKNIIAPTSKSLDIYDSNQVTVFLQQNNFSHLLYLAWPHTPPHNNFEQISFANATLEFVKIFAVNNPDSRIVVTGSIHENSPNLYGLSKKYVHDVMQVMLPEIAKEVSFCWLRLSNIYGPGDHKDKLLSRMILELLTTGNFELNNPNKTVDFVHVKDASKALVLALLSDYCGDLNIGSGAEYLLQDIRSLIQNIIRDGYPGSFHALNISDDQTSETNKILNYKAHISFSQGIAECVDAIATEVK